MDTVSYKASYLEELIYLEGVLNGHLRHQFDITDEDEMRQFFEVVYWHAAVFHIEDKKLSTKSYERMCAELDTLCEREDLEENREDLLSFIRMASAHACGLYKRILSDIGRCKDIREWLCQLKMLHFYITREHSDVAYRDAFWRFLIECVAKVDADDAVLKAIVALERNTQAVKVILSGVNN